MFDKFRLKDVLAHYKQNFVSTQWGNEKYKWEAVKWFQDNWDVNAQNFPEMLNRSLDKTFNLLASSNNFPKGYDCWLCQSRSGRGPSNVYCLVRREQGCV